MSTLPVSRSSSRCGTRTKGTSIKEVKRDRGNPGVRSPTTLPTSASFCLRPPRSSLPTPRLAYSFIAFHVKTWTNFVRVSVGSLGPPYFHTQGGLQKYVGGATSDVTSVRGLAGLIKKSRQGHANPLFYQLLLKSRFTYGDGFGYTLNVFHQFSAPRIVGWLDCPG